MKAFQILTVSGATIVEPCEVEKPEPGAGEIGLRIHAAGLNRGEFIVGGVMHGAAGKPGGTEAAGEVTSIGQGVTDWNIGDRVMGRLFGGGGGFAEYAVMAAHQAMRVPEHFSWEQAAAIPSSYLAAYDAVITGGALKAGDWMLVTAAGSAVGAASIQIAKAIGGRTIGTSGSDAKLETLKQNGLDVGFATRRPDFASMTRDIVPDGIALAVNCVGGSLFNECMAALGHGGRLATVGYVDGVHSAELDLRELHANRHIIFGISNGRRTPMQHARTVEGFRRDVLPLLERGVFTPLIDRVFEFDELPAAKQHMESDTQVGKIVVSKAGAEAEGTAGGRALREEHGHEAMHRAAEAGLVDAMRWLQAQGADVNARNDYGETPMHREVSLGQVDAMRCLQAQGADINARDRYGDTPMHREVSLGQVDAMRCLQAQGADINARNDDGKTQMHEAAEAGHVDAMGWLQAQSADVNAQDIHGRTPMYWAESGDHTSAANWLKANGARK